MRIAFINPFFNPITGGLSVVTYNLAMSLVKRGHDVLIFTSNYNRDISKFKDEEILAIIESSCNLNLFGFLYTTNMNHRLEDYAKEIDILHFNSLRTYQNIVAYKFARKYKIPYVLQAHGSLPRITGKQCLKWIYDVFFGYRLLRHASKVIALSQIEAQQYMSMDVSERKIEIIPNGINLSEYSDLPPKGSFKKKFSIDDADKIVLYLGRIHKTKGIDFLIKAYAYLVKNMEFDDALLVIAGPDDGYRHEAKSLATSLEINGKVIFAGFLSEREKLSAFVDSSLCAYLNPNEPFGIVILEAAATLKPVIVSNGTPISEIVRRGEFGFSVEYNDITGLARIMKKMLHNNDELQKMGKKGCVFVSENFTWDNVIEKFEKVYEEIIKGKQ